MRISDSKTECTECRRVSGWVSVSTKPTKKVLWNVQQKDKPQLRALCCRSLRNTRPQKAQEYFFINKSKQKKLL